MTPTEPTEPTEPTGVPADKEAPNVPVPETDHTDDEGGTDDDAFTVTGDNDEPTPTVP